jgi:hypothetical protein
MGFCLDSTSTHSLSVFDVIGVLKIIVQLLYLSSSGCLCPENVENGNFMRDLNAQICTSFPSTR